LAAHASHAPVRAVAVLKVLTAHGVHAADPLVVLYVPAGHAVQPALESPVYPGSHRHAASSVLNSGALECAGHAVLASEPDTQ
jgi:hypothetical protein